MEPSIAYETMANDVGGQCRKERCAISSKGPQAMCVDVVLLNGYVLRPEKDVEGYFPGWSPDAWAQDAGTGGMREVFQGRETFLTQFPNNATPEAQRAISHPNDSSTFERLKLHFGECYTQAPLSQLHSDLLRLRRKAIVIYSQVRDCINGAAWSSHALAIRYFDAGGFDRPLSINLGRDLHYVPVPMPLLAHRSNGSSQLMGSIDDLRCGGPGAPNPLTKQGGHAPADSAWLFRAELGAEAVSQEGEHG